MKILITGGFGYIGGRLSQYLSSIGNTAIVLGTRNQVVKPLWLPNSEVVQINWNCDDSLFQACSGVDIVIHLAAMNAQECASEPIKALEFNGVGTAKLIRAAVKQNVKKFLYFSTAHVYSSPLAGAINEETLPKSFHPYATSHRAAEDVVLASHAKKEIESVVVRLSNSFGSPVDPSVNCWMLLVNDLCRQVITTNKMVLNSTGLQRRDFITMSDVCRATFHLIKCDLSFFSRPLFNLGGTWTPTIWEMTKMISQIYSDEYGKTPELIRQLPSRDEKSLELSYSIDLLKSTGFVLQASYEKEIKDLFKFCKTRINSF